jgi:hypothetical protein
MATEVLLNQPSTSFQPCHPRYNPQIGVALLAIAAVGIVLGALAMYRHLKPTTIFKELGNAFPLSVSIPLLIIGASAFAGSFCFFIERPEPRNLLVQKNKAQPKVIKEPQVYKFRKLKTLKQNYYLHSFAFFNSHRQLAQNLWYFQVELSSMSKDDLYLELDGLEKLEKIMEGEFDKILVYIKEWRTALTEESSLNGIENLYLDIKNPSFEIQEYQRVYKILSVYFAANCQMRGILCRYREAQDLVKKIEKDVWRPNLEPVFLDRIEALAKLISKFEEALEEFNSSEFFGNPVPFNQRLFLFRRDYELIFYETRAFAKLWRVTLENKYTQASKLDFDKDNLPLSLVDYFLDEDYLEEIDLPFHFALDKLDEIEQKYQELVQRAKILKKVLTQVVRKTLI